MACWSSQGPKKTQTTAIDDRDDPSDGRPGPGQLCKTLGQPETRFPYTLHHDFVRSKWIHDNISRSDVAQMTDGEPIQHLARVAVAKAAMDAEPISLLVLERSDRKVALACLIWADWYVNDKMATKLSDR